MSYLFGKPPVPAAVVTKQKSADLDQALALAKAQGYAEAIKDLVVSLKACNSFALVSVEPAVRALQSKAKNYAQEASVQSSY